MNASDMIALVVAALGGTAVGLERQWSGHAEGPTARFAGIRTFAMLGAVGGLSGWLWSNGGAVLAGVLLSGGIAITVAAYVAASHHEIDGTTEVAALVVMGAGVLAGTGQLRVASAIVAVEVLLLVEKSQLHSLVRRIDDVELRAGVRFAVMALVILPLLPEGPYPPFDSVRPRQLWMLVLFFSGLSFLADLLNRVVGPHGGALLSGAIGGLISSTNVTFTFARSSRGNTSHSRSLAFGAIAANAMLYPRVLTAVAVLNAALLPTLVPLIAAPALVAGIVAAIGAVNDPREREVRHTTLRNPLQLPAALRMAALFQVVLVVVRLAQNTWGRSGVLTTAAALGLTDVDALTVSMTKGVADTLSMQTAALAIAVGILANNSLKASIALLLGEKQFRTIVAGTLGLVTAVSAISIVILL